MSLRGRPIAGTEVLSTREIWRSCLSRQITVNAVALDFDERRGVGAAQLVIDQEVVQLLVRVLR